MKLKLRTLIIAAFVLGILFIFTYNHASYITSFVRRQIQESYEIKTIRVISGHEFDLTLRDERRVYVKLKVETPQEAKEKVIAYINRSRSPYIIVYNKEDNVWVVDILFESGSLTEWLYAQKLAWDNSKLPRR